MMLTYEKLAKQFSQNLLDLTSVKEVRSNKAKTFGKADLNHFQAMYDTVGSEHIGDYRRVCKVWKLAKTNNFYLEG